MVTLKLHRPHWIDDEGDDPSDQCAHGFVELTVEGIEFVSESEGEWTVSAAALFLLRTVNADHVPEDSVAEGNFLIPCCGFSIWPSEETKYPYSIVGCNQGIDPTIRHSDGFVHLSLGDKSASVPSLEWTKAVSEFSDQVQRFYDSCAEKDELIDDFERKGWELFWQDWRARRRAVMRALGDT